MIGSTATPTAGPGRTEMEGTNPARTTSQHPLVARLVNEIESGDDPMPTIAKIDRKLRNPPLPELWGVKAVAEHLGIADYQNVYKLKGKGLPEAAYGGEDSRYALDRGQLWTAASIREYAKTRKAGR